MSADTTVKFFSSTQTGAPTVNNVAGTLISVLDAVLVNGFGLKTCDSVVINNGVGVATISSGHAALVDGVVLFAGANEAAINGERKVTSITTTTITFDATGLANTTGTGTITMKIAPLGWTKAFSGTNLAAYKSSLVTATGCYLRVDDTTTTYAAVRGCEAMTDINTYTGVFPTTAAVSVSNWPKAASSTASPWWIIGNGSIFYIGIATYASAYPSGFMYRFFGDITSRKTADAYRCSIGSANSTQGSDLSAIYTTIGNANNQGQASRYIARQYSALGSAVAISLDWQLTRIAGNDSGNGTLTFPNPSDNGLIITPIAVIEATGIRGEMPGLLASPQGCAASINDDVVFSNVAGLGRNVVHRRHCANSSNSAWYSLFFDRTGPWGN